MSEQAETEEADLEQLSTQRLVALEIASRANVKSPDELFKTADGVISYIQTGIVDSVEPNTSQS